MTRKPKPAPGDDEAAERWARTFQPADDLAALAASRHELEAAQAILDEQILHRLLDPLGELPCDDPRCTAPATLAVFCSHTGQMIGVYCHRYRSWVLGLPAISCFCGITWMPGYLLTWRTIFEGRDHP